MPPDSDVQKRINAIRMLSIDAVQKANSGHPGLPLGAAPMAYAIWANHLKFNAGDLAWADRDRFVLSAGHGSMLLYALLYLTGGGLTLDDLKHFRQFESKTPGHPESHMTAGVEVTTGPLGQGVANAVGLAIAEAHLAAVYNRNQKIVDHHTYVIASDGDLMEGVSAEAGSLAGHLRLGKLIVLYDDNHVSLAAPTDHLHRRRPRTLRGLRLAHAAGVARRWERRARDRRRNRRSQSRSASLADRGAHGHRVRFAARRHVRRTRRAARSRQREEDKRILRLAARARPSRSARCVVVVARTRHARCGRAASLERCARGLEERRTPQLRAQGAPPGRNAAGQTSPGPPSTRKTEALRRATPAER